MQNFHTSSYRILISTLSWWTEFYKGRQT